MNIQHVGSNTNAWSVAQLCDTMMNYLNSKGAVLWQLSHICST